MNFLAYELLANPEIQQKLYEEILEMNTKLDGAKLSYDDIQSMKYLDQVVSETLRMWPSTPVKLFNYFLKIKSNAFFKDD